MTPYISITELYLHRVLEFGLPPVTRSHKLNQWRFLANWDRMIHVKFESILENFQWNAFESTTQKCRSYRSGANRPLTIYVKLRVVYAPGMPGTFSPLPRVSGLDTHDGTCAMHVPWCMPGSLTSGVLWSRWRGKRSRHSRRMRNPQFYVSDKRPTY